MGGPGSGRIAGGQKTTTTKTKTQTSKNQKPLKKVVNRGYKKKGGVSSRPPNDILSPTSPKDIFLQPAQPVEPAQTNVAVSNKKPANKSILQRVFGPTTPAPKPTPKPAPTKKHVDVLKNFIKNLDPEEVNYYEIDDEQFMYELRTNSKSIFPEVRRLKTLIKDNMKFFNVLPEIIKDFLEADTDKDDKMSIFFRNLHEEDKIMLMTTLYYMETKIDIEVKIQKNKAKAKALDDRYNTFAEILEGNPLTKNWIKNKQKEFFSKGKKSWWDINKDADPRVEADEIIQSAKRINSMQSKLSQAQITGGRRNTTTKKPKKSKKSTKKTTKKYTK